MEVTSVVRTEDQSATDSDSQRVRWRDFASGEEGAALGPEIPALVTMGFTCVSRGRQDESGGYGT